MGDPGTAAAEFWVYDDEFVRPFDAILGTITVLSQLLLAPVIAVVDAIEGTDRTAPLWITKRTTWLSFEDERLAEWRFEFWNDWDAESGGERGPEMIFDPEFGAFRVADCGRVAVIDPTGHEHHCADYFHQGRFYRHDADGWCAGMRAYGLFQPVEYVAVPRRLREHEAAASEPILSAQQMTIEATASEARARIASIRAAEREAIERARSESDAKVKQAAIEAAERDADAKVTAVRQAWKRDIRKATNAADASVEALHAMETRSLRTKRAKWRASAAEAAIGALKQQAGARVAAIREAEQRAIDAARAESDRDTKQAAIRAARNEAREQIEAVRKEETQAITNVETRRGGWARRGRGAGWGGSPGGAADRPTSRSGIHAPDVGSGPGDGGSESGVGGGRDNSGGQRVRGGGGGQRVKSGGASRQPRGGGGRQGGGGRRGGGGKQRDRK
jgi:hypothetical protein